MANKNTKGERLETYSVVGLVTAMSVGGFAVGIGGDNGGEGQKNQSDLKLE